MSAPPSILILSGSFGHGHNTAAFNLQRAFQVALGKDAKIDVLDFFAEAYPLSNALMRKGYGLAINRLPGVWKRIYGMADCEGGPSLVPRKLFAKRLGRALAERAPSVVVSTFPIFPLLLEQLYPEAESRPFLTATMITDAISINAIWCQGASDLLFVTDAWSKEIVIQEGIAEDKVHAYGFPLSQPAAAKALVALPEGPLRLLYLPTTTTAHVRETLRHLVPWCAQQKAELTVVLGSHEARLRGAVTAAMEPLPQGQGTVHGWRNDVPTLMREHHLTLTKAGGATVSETLGAQCPVLLNYVVPGQEEGNAELIKRSDCGRHIDHASELPQALSQILIEEDASTWHRYRANLAAMNRADASAKIVREILTQTSDAAGS